MLILPLLFVGLCIAIVILCHRSESLLKDFLKRNPAIVNEQSLDEYKVMVRANMHLALITIGIIIAAVAIVTIWVFLQGISGALVLPLLGLSFGFSNKVDSLEQKARSLDCATDDLERRHREISRIWRKNAFPNF
ncbi:hypothetical protein IQ249_24840 [Lusitaniella coriacea LEGE 07157]|uniref:Uncharacterized protein n=2 Tax=Lusitaniella TaxID=1983104 RepID=A0A8J7E290_9CYAN|nr:hypothetical protein [Lusitaniella coriacea LEGE 07157]